MFEASPYACNELFAPLRDKFDFATVMRKGSIKSIRVERGPKKFYQCLHDVCKFGSIQHMLISKQKYTYIFYKNVLFTMILSPNSLNCRFHHKAK